MENKLPDKAECRAGCAACCIVISISSPLPKMPEGKPAGIRCLNLDLNNNCTIHRAKDYPAVCSSFKPSDEMCGADNEFAFSYLEKMEIDTK